ncbi:MAG: hypothetical protein JOZ08_05550 [Verrucomicrobia bacterium]|nr:hypothetical protein [Verrucomicrobiota bacterium]MBV8280143.1 hypothetical protein [Verrucomicrobiota bacterium]
MNTVSNELTILHYAQVPGIRVSKSVRVEATDLIGLLESELEDIKPCGVFVSDLSFVPSVVGKLDGFVIGGEAVNIWCEHDARENMCWAALWDELKPITRLLSDAFNWGNSLVAFST